MFAAGKLIVGDRDMHISEALKALLSTACCIQVSPRFMCTEQPPAFCCRLLECCGVIATCVLAYTAMRARIQHAHLSRASGILA